MEILNNYAEIPTMGINQGFLVIKEEKIISYIALAPSIEVDYRNILPMSDEMGMTKIIHQNVAINIFKM